MSVKEKKQLLWVTIAARTQMDQDCIDELCLTNVTLRVSLARLAKSDAAVAVSGVYMEDIQTQLEETEKKLAVVSTELQQSKDWMDATEIQMGLSREAIESNDKLHESDCRVIESLREQAKRQ
jgi:hypothetical protein